jgi:hypothetical protein
LISVNVHGGEIQRKARVLAGTAGQWHEAQQGLAKSLTAIYVLKMQAGSGPALTRKGSPLSRRNRPNTTADFLLVAVTLPSWRRSMRGRGSVAAVVCLTFTLFRSFRLLRLHDIWRIMENVTRSFP